MEYLVFVESAHLCEVLIREFLAVHKSAGTPDPGPGSVIKCDCGLEYQMGQFGDWIKK